MDSNTNQTVELDTKEMYARLIDQAPDGFVLCNQSGTIMFVNQQFSSLTGYSQEELLGMSLKDLVPPDDEHHTLGFLLQMKALEPIAIQHRVKRKDGSILPIEGHYILRTDEFFQGFIHDITARIEQEEHIKESEALYRALVETSPDGVLLTDLQAKISFASKAAAKLHGTDDPLELIGKSSYDFIIPEDRMRATTNALRSLAGVPIRSIEYCCMRKDGTRFYAELNASLLRDIHGLPKGFVGTIHDVTYRKEIEQKVKDSESRLRLYLENISDVIMVIDSNMTITYVSPSCHRVLGYTPEEMVGKRVDTFFHPDEKEKVQQRITEGFIHIGAIQTLEYFHLHRDGSWRLLGSVVKTTRDANGHVFAISCAHDVTDQRATEEELKKQDTQLRTITEHMQDIVGQIDAKSIVTYISPSIAAILGYHPKDVIGKPITDHIHSEDIHILVDTLAKAVSEKKSSVIIIIRYERSDKVFRWIEFNASLLFNGQGMYTGCVFASRDVTEKKLVQENLEARARELEIVNQSMLGREMKMVELKRELVEAQEKLAQLSKTT